jgi:hypothetical protein
MTAIEIISKAVAIPFVLNMACRRGTMAYNAIMAIKLNTPDCRADSFFPFDIPKCLGSKLVVARGQIFRHKPVHTTNNAGATGIKMFQNNNIPTGG